MSDWFMFITVTLRYNSLRAESANNTSDRSAEGSAETPSHNRTAFELLSWLLSALCYRIERETAKPRPEEETGPASRQGHLPTDAKEQLFASLDFSNR